FLARARAGSEGAGLAFDRLELGQELAHHRLAEPRADAPDGHQLLAAMYACDQRAQLLSLLGPAADDDFLPGTALGLDPAADPAAAVGRAELLGHDALETHAAGRCKHGIARRLEMVDVADLLALVLEAVEQLLQPRLALGERQGPEILAL